MAKKAVKKPRTRVPKGESLSRRPVKKSEKIGRRWIGGNSTKKPTRPVPEGKRPWAEEVAERIAKREALELTMTPEQYAEHRRGKCQGVTSGTYGPSRPCDRWAIKGHVVCPTHGGSIKATKEAARKRIIEEVHPTINRLVELRDQDMHYPTAIAATKEILNRAMGKPEATQGQLGAGAPQIIIGVRLGGLPTQIVTANQQKQLTDANGGDEDDVAEGEVVSDNNEDAFKDPFDE